VKITTRSAGILDNFSDTSILDENETWPLARFLNFLNRKLENRLMAAIFANHELREDICILLNGRNTRLLPEGLQIRLNDGDSLFICIVISGG